MAQVDGSGIVEKPVTRPESFATGMVCPEKPRLNTPPGGAVEFEPRSARVGCRLNKVDKQIAVGRNVGERRRERDVEDPKLHGWKLCIIDRRVVRTEVRRKVRAEAIDGGRGGRQRDLDHARVGRSRLEPATVKNSMSSILTVPVKSLAAYTCWYSGNPAILPNGIKFLTGPWRADDDVGRRRSAREKRERQGGRGDSRFEL